MSKTLIPSSQRMGLTDERPWPGPDSYAEADKDFFFGREIEAVELHRLVRAEPLALLFGISGLGTTSLLNAGLFPRLRAVGWLPVWVRLDFARNVAPLTQQVLQAAARSAKEKGIVVPQWQKSDTLWQAFHRRGQLFWGVAPEPATPVLVLDQFEECFTLGQADPATRQHTTEFLTQLSDLVENHALRGDNASPADASAFTAEAVPLRVVLSLREDYLATLEALRGLFPGLRRARLRLLPFTAVQARKVVEGPGAHLLAPGAADAILDTFLPSDADPADTVVDPALLSLFCWQFNEQRLTAGLQRLEADRIVGSRERILSDFYSSAFDGLENSDAVRRWVEDCLVDAGDFRASRSWNDALATSGVTAPALELLIKRRLLHPFDRPGAPTQLELTHDRLCEVVVKRRETRRTAEAKAAAEARAADAAADAARQRQLAIELSRLLRRSRLATIVMAFCFVLAVAAAVFGFWQKHKAEKAARRATAAEQSATEQAEFTREVTSQANLCLARYSQEAGNDSQALAHLAQALRFSQKNYEAAAFASAMLSHTGWPLPVGATMRHNSSIGYVQFSRDGRRLVTASNDKTARLWDVLTGKPIGEPMQHRGFVYSAEFSPDGQRVVTASEDKTAQLWNALTGEPTGEPMQHQGAIYDAQFSPDGRRVVTASRDGTAQLWDGLTGNPIGEPMQHENWVVSARFSPDGRRVVTASADWTAQLWDALTGNPIGEPMKHQGVVYSAQFSPDGQRVVTASWDHSARLWDARTGKPIGQPMQHKSMVNSVEFSPDGQRVVTGSADQTARLWDARTGKPIGQPMQHQGPVNSAQFSSDAERVVTASDDKTARLWDAESGKAISEPMRHGGEVNSARFSADGQRVVTASGDETARLWDTESGKAIDELMRHGGEVNSARFSPDGQRVVTASYDKTAQLWDHLTGKPIGQPMQHRGFVYSAEFSPDGRRVVTASADWTAQLWDALTGNPIGEPMQHQGVVCSAQFSPDGQRVVTASWDHSARLWDARTGKPIGQPMRHKSVVYSAEFSPDGQRVVTASEDQTAQLWDTESGKAIGEPMRHGREVNSARFSPDGWRIVTASSDNTARLWDARTGKAIGEPMQHRNFVTFAEFSPDGRRIVTASSDNTAQLWDGFTGKVIGEPMRHRGPVSSARFSADGQRVVTACQDGTARLWDALTGKAIGEPIQHGDPINSAQFSPDGQRVVTASQDGMAWLWDVPAISGKEAAEDVLLLAALSEATGGVSIKISEQATIQNALTPEEIRDRREKIAARFAGAPAELSPLQRCMKWSVSELRSRTISPFSEITVAGWEENRINEGTLDSLRSAIQFDPANARLAANFGLRLAEFALKPGADPDEARRAQAEADFQTHRALSLASDNEEVKKLRAEVVKLLLGPMKGQRRKNP